MRDRTRHDEIEAMLAAMPTVELPADARARVCDGLLSVRAEAPEHWWNRRFPFWQAVAACLVLAAAAFFAGGRLRTPDRPAGPSPNVDVRQEETNLASTAGVSHSFRRPAKPAFRFQLNRWRVQDPPMD